MEEKSGKSNDNFKFQMSNVKFSMRKLRICHLYPDLMDTYGDRGNIITLVKRCQWRGIEAKVTAISVGDSLSTFDFDLFFFGGGQDRQQVIVGKDLQKKAKQLKEAVDKGKVLLSICGGYQLLQKYFRTKEGQEISGIGLFDAYTLGSDDRMIQNLLVQLSPDLLEEVKSAYPGNHSRSEQGSIQSHFGSGQQTSLLSLREAQRRSNLKDSSLTLRMTEEGSGLTKLIGFENHSGKTYFEGEIKPLGTVIAGAGNNGEDKTEGAVYKNAFGCYLHGSLLPKNPHFADLLISKALNAKLEPLDDAIEWQAHMAAIRRTKD